MLSLNSAPTCRVAPEGGVGKKKERDMGEMEVNPQNAFWVA